MALDVSGFALLKAIGANPDAFPNVGTDASKYALMLATKQLRAKGTDLEAVRRIGDVLGRDSLRFIIEGMNDSTIKSLLGKLDKYHPELKTSDALWRRMHLRALVEEKAEPTGKPASKPRRKAAPKSKDGPTVEAKGRPKAKVGRRKKSEEPAFLDLLSMTVKRRRG